MVGYESIVFYKKTSAYTLLHSYMMIGEWDCVFVH